MTESESKLRQRTDGRLDRSRDPAILDGALAALAVHGYDATNMNDIAERDWSLVADVLTAMGLIRVISGQSVDAKYVRQVIDTLVLPPVRATKLH